jgi:hypothetical protein
MKSFRAGGDDIERDLRVARPEPRDAFVTGVVDDIRATRRRRFARRRVAVATAMTVVMVSAFGAFGGFGYAASAASQAAKAVTGSNGNAASPAQSQYGKKCGQAPATGGATKPAAGTPPGNPGNNTCPGNSGPKK